ncbi:hypothetical protein BDM02DRAFT_872609 [Thelephora ganbajun]|uniref:Uncharacterized protein n=1 Tax=Thelephora ganbajun TaxID=370292 RepID=A0ACB6Z5G2_THEGA|nr:hypothetical protein BDM02DRAFT_872609 [Thelephora ganbajun]
MAVGLCLNCSVEKDMRSLKKCGGCGIALYCSTECQKISWKTTHKYSCVSVAPLPSMGIEDFDRRFNKTIERWMYEWRGILEGYSMAALDLANYPERHITHAMCLELRHTGNKIPARSFEFMNGRVCAIEEILSRQPELKVLRDPPSLVGQRVHYVMAFYFDPANTKISRCKIRAQAWTDPSIGSRWHLLDKEISAFLAMKVFDLAKSDFEKGDPNKMRAGEVEPFLQLML